jgi:integrase/recombinase XerD
MDVPTELVRRLATFFLAAGVCASPGQPRSPARLRDAVASVLAEKTDEGLSRQYVVSLRQYLAQFERAVGPDTPVGEIDAAAIERWFASRNEAPATQASNLGRLASLFAHAVRRGHIRDNPVRLIRPPRLRPPPPRILSPAEAASLLSDCRSQCPEILAWIVLGMFAGIRPMECLGLPWSAVDAESGRVRVDRTKTSQRRVAHLEPAAVAWLAVCPRESKHCCPSWSTIRRRRRALRPGWPQDVLRHTAASYLLELHQDAGKVALWLGNSQRILLRHYRELVSPRDCAGFWALRPTAAPADT